MESMEQKAVDYDSQIYKMKRRTDAEKFMMFPIDSQTKIDDQFVFIKMETQGWRQTMEDFIMFQKIEGINHELDDLFGIFDGHGGYLVSLFCKVTFPDVM